MPRTPFDWLAKPPLTIPIVAAVGPTLVFGRSCRLLNAHLRNAGAATVITFFDGETIAGNDRLAVGVPANGDFQESLMDVGIYFDNGITITQVAAQISGYLLIAMEPD